MSNNNNPFIVKGDKALQLIQTIMLAALLGGGAWTWKTTQENQNTLSRLQEQSLNRGEEMTRFIKTQDVILQQLDVMKNADATLDRRVSIIETRIKP